MARAVPEARAALEDPVGRAASFRSYRYGPEYPGLVGKDLTPGEKLVDLMAKKNKEAAPAAPNPSPQSSGDLAHELRPPAGLGGRGSRSDPSFFHTDRHSCDKS